MTLKRPSSRQVLLTLVGLGLTAIASWHAYYYGNSTHGIGFLDSLERYTYDLRMKASAKAGLDPRIIIVDIDEQSLQRYGQWPWSRSQIARLVKRLLNQYQVDTIGFDIVFAKPEQTYPIELIKQVVKTADEQATPARIAEMLTNHQGDKILAGAINEQVVLGYFFESDGRVEKVGVLPMPVFNSAELAHETHAPRVRRYTSNIPLLQAASSQAGFFSLVNMLEPDGIIRRAALLNNYDGKLYGALSLMMARQYLGNQIDPVLAPIESDSNYPALEGLRLGQGTIPLDAQAAVFVPYRQTESSYRTIPAWQVLDAKIKDADSLVGTLVLVGTSAAGLRDLRGTPLGNDFSGVEIHANLLSGLLDASFLKQPNWTLTLNIVLVVVIGTALAFLLPALSIAKSTALSGGVFSAMVLTNLHFWFNLKWVVPIATLCILIWALYSLNTVVGFFAESHSRQIMRRMFGLYVPNEIVDAMSASDDVYSLKSEKREMTVLFSDVRNFTAASEQLAPEEISALLNTLLTPITEIIHHHQGAIDKYMGDGVMAFWGAPLKTEQHASKAITAALEISERLSQINQEFNEKGWPVMQMGIGISTGPMNVGNMGSEFRMAYTVLGDSVNLGSRLERLTKLYGVEIIVSERTRNRASEFDYQELDIVRVKGKQKPEKIYLPLGHHDKVTDATRAVAYQVKNMLAHYRAGHWRKALDVLQSLELNLNTGLIQLYADRIEQLKQTPPADDWDGVINLLEK